MWAGIRLTRAPAPRVAGRSPAPPIGTARPERPPSGAFVGRVAGDDVGYADKTGAEARAEAREADPEQPARPQTGDDESTESRAAHRLAEGFAQAVLIWSPADRRVEQQGTAGRWRARRVSLMALSAHERCILSNIEDEVVREDPELARALAWLNRRRRGLVGWLFRRIHRG